MIRILHVIDSFDLGGAQTALLQFVRFADRSRFEIEVASMHGEGVFVDRFRECATRVHSLSRRRFPPMYVPRLFKLLRSGGFDIGHFHLFGANWIGKPVAAAAGLRIRFNHDQCNDAFRSERWLALLMDRWTNRLSTRVLGVSQSTCRFLETHEGLDPGRLRFLPNSVDTETFLPPGDAERAAARAALGIPADAFVVAGMGRLHPQKDFSTFLSVAAATGSAGAVFIISGTGPEEELLKRSSKALGLEKRVRFLGFRSDPLPIYHAADVLLLTSRYEGLPMVLLEAMASGCAFVGTRVDGTLEVVEHGRTGFLAEVGDVRGLGECLGRLRSEPPLRLAMASAARAEVVARYDARRVTAQLEAMYLECLRGCKTRQ